MLCYTTGCPEHKLLGNTLLHASVLQVDLRLNLTKATWLPEDMKEALRVAVSGASLNL